jgi:hypothetical protein
MNFGDDNLSQLSAHAKPGLRSLFVNNPITAIQLSVPTSLLETLQADGDVHADIVIGGLDPSDAWKTSGRAATAI